MPAVIDTTEVIEHEEYTLYEEHDLYKEQPPVREAHPGFWHRVMQYVKRHRVHTSTGTPLSCQGSPHPVETPMERLARENPTLYLRVFTGL